MKLRLLTVGRAPQWMEDGFAHYADRLPADNALELSVVPRRRGKTDEQRLLEAVRSQETLVLLDQRGRPVSSAELAELLAEWRMGGRDIALLIGGLHGFGDAARQRARYVLSLSAMTFPHQLVRVMIAEQIYRAWAILHGHPYHRRP